MQPGEEIESLVDELEQIVTEAKSPIMDSGQKKIVDAQDIYEILDEIRRVFPQEFADARRPALARLRRGAARQRGLARRSTSPAR